MSARHYILLPVLLALGPSLCLAQPSEKKIEEYLHATKFPVDTEAAAVVLYEHVQVAIVFEGNGLHGAPHESFKQTRTEHRIVKILKKAALENANVKIRYSSERYWENLKKVTGLTYTLEGSEVKKTKLPKADFYKSTIVDGYREVSFAMPDVKVGSIIEYSFEVDESGADFTQEWRIQGASPKLESEFSFTYPAVLSFKSIVHAGLQVKEFNDEAKAKSATNEFGHTANTISTTNGTSSMFWVRRNVPAINEEPFVTNINNHTEYVIVQLAKVRLPGSESFMSSWDKVNEQLWNSIPAKAIRKDNAFLTDTVKKITASCANKTARAKAIFNYVRANYRANEASKIEKGNIAEVFRAREGTPRNINLLLGAMLNNAGLTAYQLYTSTTDKVSANETIPVEGSFNHVACAWAVDGAYVLLDATDKNNTFGMLPLDCYNGYARIISKEGDAIEITPELLEDQNNYAVKVSFPGDGVQAVEITSKLGLISSGFLRDEMAKGSFDKAAYCEKYMGNVAADAHITEMKFENENKPDTNLTIKIVYQSKMDAGASTYFLPTSFIKVFTANPFSVGGRTYAIEYPYKVNNVYRISYFLPDGMVGPVATQPRVIKLGEGDMVYQKETTYLEDMNLLTINSVFKRNRINYPADGGGNLKPFYEEVIKEENKVIEVKKK